MEIKIEKIEGQRINGDPGASDFTDAYRVMDNGNEFVITFTSHRYGSNLGIAGQKGILYTDPDSRTVRLQVIGVGRGCGVSIESDEPVQGLSSWALRGVILANREKGAKEIILTTEAPEAGFDEAPTAFIDGRRTDLTERL